MPETKSKAVKALTDRTKSKTYWFGLAVLVLGFIQSNFPKIEAMLGEYSGPVYVGIGIVSLVLRELTSTSLSEKSS